MYSIGDYGAIPQDMYGRDGNFVDTGSVVDRIKKRMAGIQARSAGLSFPSAIPSNTPVSTNKPVQTQTTKAPLEPFPTMHPDDMQRMISYTRDNTAGVLPPLPEFDDRYQNRTQVAYDLQLGDIRSALGRGSQKYQDIMDGVLSVAGNLKTGAGAAIGLNMLQGATGASAGLDEKEASLVGALPLVSNITQAMGHGGQARRAAQQSMFEEGLPSKKALTDYHTQQAKQLQQTSALGAIPVNAIMALPEKDRLAALQKFQGHTKTESPFGKIDPDKYASAEPQQKAIMAAIAAGLSPSQIEAVAQAAANRVTSKK